MQASRAWRSWWLAGIAALSAGCSVAPEIPAPAQVFGSYPSEPVRIADPLPLGQRPPARLHDIGGQQLLCFDRPAAQELLSQRNAAEANTRIAGELAEAARAMQRERARLVEAGRICESAGQTLHAALQDERAEHADDNMIHRSIIAGLLLVLIL